MRANGAPKRCSAANKPREVGSAGSRRNRRSARHRPRDAGAQAASLGGGHRRQPARGTPAASVRVPLLASPIGPHLILAAAQPLPLIDVCCDGAASSVWPTTATLPWLPMLDIANPMCSHRTNLRPSRRAGTAPLKGLPARDARRRALARAVPAWQAEAGSRERGDRRSNAGSTAGQRGAAHVHAVMPRAVPKRKQVRRRGPAGRTSGPPSIRPRW